MKTNMKQGGFENGLETLLLLACPLMMLFCMKGMFSGNKEKETKGNPTQQSDFQSLSN